MPTQHIYLKEEIYNQLKKSGNMSSLINDLLSDYFKSNNKTDKQVIKEVENLIKEKEKKEKDKTRQDEDLDIFEKYSRKFPNNQQFQQFLKEGKFKDYKSYIESKIKNGK